MRPFSFLLLLFTISFSISCHAHATPKLMVGIVVDQMRWDNLFRYQNRYKENGGFRRLLREGFACHNTLIPYIPTYTACGHASIYTGTTPAYHGIVGNEWYDRKIGKRRTAVADKTPNSLEVSTIGDELKIASIGKSHVYSVSLKDRAAILPGGHAADCAFWWNDSLAQWQTSAYYGELPTWARAYNQTQKEKIDAYYKKGWHTLYPISSYTHSTNDTAQYEQGIVDKNVSHFPYELKNFIDKNYKKVIGTPYGLEMTAEFAKEIIRAAQLGKNTNGATDMLAISFSSTDYIGHAYGPSSVETEDAYLRLDAILGDLLDYIEQTVGKENVLVFLTADHGVSPVAEHLHSLKIPALAMDTKKIKQDLETDLQQHFKRKKIKFIASTASNQIYLNNEKITSAGLQLDAVRHYIVSYLNQLDEVSVAFDTHPSQVSNIQIPTEVYQHFRAGFYARRSGDIQIIFKSNYMDGWFVPTPAGERVARGTTHGTWRTYDTHIPLIFYGGTVRSGESFEKYSMTDIAPTICAMLRIEFPSGSVGSPISEAMQMEDIVAP